MISIHRSCCSEGVREKIAVDIWFLLIDLSMAGIEAKCKGLWTPCKASRCFLQVDFCEPDQGSIFYRGRKGKRVPLVEGLTLIPFVHDIFDQIPCDRDDARALVRCPVVSGEDIDRLCFVHTDSMAQKKRFRNRLCATSSTGRDLNRFGI